MQFAIIQTSTRVIRRLTSNEVPDITSDETAIDVSSKPLDLAGGPWKLDIDNKSLLKPLAIEIDSSGVDERRNAILKGQKQDDFKASIDAVIADATISQKIRDFFVAFKNL